MIWPSPVFQRKVVPRPTCTVDPMAAEHLAVRQPRMPHPGKLLVITSGWDCNLFLDLFWQQRLHAGGLESL